MPMYDRLCPMCETQQIDCWEPVTAPTVPCTACGEPTVRAWLTKPANVIGDDIPGGVLIRHGLCNEDGSPRRYYTKSDIAAEAKRRGLVNVVRHAPETRDSDKSRHTTRWH